MFHSFRRLFPLLGLLLLCGAQSLEAQRPQTREGFWANFGFGWASLGCDGCENREEGGAAALALGGTLSPHWQLGGGVHLWTKEQGQVTRTVSLVSFMAKFYPSSAGGFHLIGGLGVASIDFEVGNRSVSEAGSGIVLGVGYDIRIGRNVSLTPFWNGVATKYDGGGDPNFGQLGLGLTIH